LGINKSRPMLDKYVARRLGPRDSLRRSSRIRTPKVHGRREDLVPEMAYGEFTEKVLVT
jgi:hypothetical protein